MLCIFDFYFLSGAGRAHKRIGRDPLMNLHGKGAPLDPGVNVQPVQWSDPSSGMWLMGCLVLFSPAGGETIFFRALTDCK